MSTNEFTIKAGDRLPTLEIQLLDCQGNPLDLTPYPDIMIVIAPCVGGRRIVDMAPVVLDGLPTAGKILYHWAPGQTDKPGEYLLEVILSPNYDIVPKTSQQLMTLPGGGYGKVIITPRL